MRREESGWLDLADFFYVLGFLFAMLRVCWYLSSARPDETYGEFHSRMDFGEFSSPAIRARMERDPAYRARMDALLRSRAFRLKLAEVESTRSSLGFAIDAAEHCGARVKAARRANTREPNGGATGDGEESEGFLEAGLGDASIKARVVEAAAKYEAAKAAVDRMIAVATLGRVPASGGGVGVRGRDGSAPVAAEASTRASRRTGAAATVEPMEISTATSTEEFRSLI